MAHSQRNPRFKKLKTKFFSKQFIGTITLIALNTVLYAAMVIASSDHTLGQESTKTLISWGANYGPMTLTGQPWRLLTCTFIHSHLPHLLLNLFSLYVLGKEIEVLIGTRKFLLIYLLSGIIGSLASLAFQPVSVSVGASGAVFGIFGCSFALLGAKTFEQLVSSLKRRIIVFIIFFLVAIFPTFFVPGIDNSAHIGGVIAGLLAGVAVSASTSDKFKAIAMATLVTLLLIPPVAYSAIEAQYKGDLRFESQNYLIEASELIDNKEFDKALTLLSRGLEILPEGSDPKYNKSRLSLLTMRAGVYVELKRPEDALRDIEATESISENRAQFTRSKALALFEMKRYSEALALYEETLALKPDDPGLYNAIAWTQAAMAKLDEGLENVDKSLAKKSDATDAIDTRGTIYLLMKNYEKALEDFDRAIKLKPKQSAAYFHRAGVYLEQGELEKCDADLKTAKELEYKPDVWEPDAFGPLIERSKTIK